MTGDKVLLLYMDENGKMCTAWHTPYDRDLSAGDVEGLREHCEKCEFCAARYASKLKR